MDAFALEMAAAHRREEALRRAELMRLVAQGRPHRRRVRVRHRLAHVLIAAAVWIDDAPRRVEGGGRHGPRLAGA